MAEMKHLKKPEPNRRPPREELPASPRRPGAPMGRDRAFKAALAEEFGVAEVPRRLQRRTQKTLESLPDTLPVRQRPVLWAVRSLAATMAVLAVTFASLMGLNTTHPQLTEALPGLGSVFAAMNAGPAATPSPSPSPSPTPEPRFQPVAALSKGDFSGVLTINDAWTDGNVLALDMSISPESSFYEKFGFNDPGDYDYLFLAPRAETDDSEPFSTGVLTVSTDSGYRDFPCDQLVFTLDGSGKFNALWQLDLEGLEVGDSIKLGLEMPDISANYGGGGSEGAYFSYAGFSASFAIEVDHGRDRVLSLQAADGPVSLKSVDYAPGRVELDVSLPYLGMIGDLYDENGSFLEFPLGAFPRLTCMGGEYEYELYRADPEDLGLEKLAADGSAVLDLCYTFKASSLYSQNPRDLKGPLTLTLYEFPQNDGPLGRVMAEFTIDLSTGRAYPSSGYEEAGYEKADPTLTTRQRLEIAMTDGLLLPPTNSGTAITGAAYGPYIQFTIYSDVSYAGRELQVKCYLEDTLEDAFTFVIDGGPYGDEHGQYYTDPYYLPSSGHEYLSTTVIANLPDWLISDDGSYTPYDRLELIDPFSGEVLIPDLAKAWRESYIELLGRDPTAEASAGEADGSAALN